MKVLMLSQDLKILDEGSAVARRIASYEVIAENLAFVLFGVGGRKEKMLASNLSVVAPGGVNKIDAFLRGTREVLKLLKKNHFDIVSAQDPFFLGTVGLCAARANRIPFQAQLHTDCFSFAYAFQSFRQCVETVLAFFVISGASCVRVVSSRIAHSIASFSSVSVTVLPIRVPTINMETFPVPSEFHSRFTVLSVARMTKEKQLHLLIDAVALLPEVDLILVGEGPLRKNLESRVQRLGLSERVRFSGWQNPHPYYAHANAYASVSRFEGYGMAVVEAALYGLPIVTTDTGVVGEMLRDGEEVLVVPPRADSVAAAVQKLQKNDSFRAALGAAARKKAEGASVSESEYLTRYRQALISCGSKTAS